MTGLLSRMLNDPRQRQTAARSDENNFERVAEGISILFGNESGSAPSTDDIPSSTDETASTSAAATENEASGSPEVQLDSSSSSSEDDSMTGKPKYDYVKQKFVGHRNARTMIKEANFWGDDFVRNSFVVPSSLELISL